MYIPDVTCSIIWSSSKGKTPENHSPDELMRCINSYVPTLQVLLAPCFVQEHQVCRLFGWLVGFCLFVFILFHFFWLPLISIQLWYRLPATSSSIFFLNLSSLSRKYHRFPAICNYTCELRVQTRVKVCSTRHAAGLSNRSSHRCPPVSIHCLSHPKSAGSNRCA